VIAKLDRLSRDIAFIANLQKSKVEFVCVDMPEANTLTIGMMAVLAQYERELISERTKAGLAAAKRRGVKLGNPNLHLVRPTDTTPATAALVANAEHRNSLLRELITELEIEEGREMSTRELAAALNDAGYKTARGKQFSSGQISRLKAA
jgi:DNA invertase Pin-like site-specific DNA recombinase